MEKPVISVYGGDYPIISPEEARQTLLENRYINDTAEEFPGAEYIRKTELVYRGGREQFFIPYYRIYVEILAAIWVMG